MVCWSLVGWYVCSACSPLTPVTQLQVNDSRPCFVGKGRDGESVLFFSPFFSFFFFSLSVQNVCPVVMTL